MILYIEVSIRLFIEVFNWDRGREVRKASILFIEDSILFIKSWMHKGINEVFFNPVYRGLNSIYKGLDTQREV